MYIGQPVKVIDNTLHRSIEGTVTQIEICFFRVTDNWNGNSHTFHWNDNIDIEEDIELTVYP